MGRAANAATIGALQFDAGMGVGGANNLFWLDSSQDKITATAGGGQATAFQLTCQINRVTTVATLGDSVALPAAVAGATVILINGGANAMQVFANATSSDTIDGIAGSTGVSQMMNSVVLYIAPANGAWVCEGIGTGVAGQYQTFSYADGLTAHAGGGQGSATPITTMTAMFGTVATPGDSAILPNAKPGMEITVVNKTATSMNVFPASGETINGAAANTQVAVAGGASGSVTIFYCGTAAAWWTK